MANKTKKLKYDPRAKLLLRDVDAKRYRDWAVNKNSFLEYQSFINVSSTHSMGRKHRLWCEKQTRIVELMSDGEHNAYRHLLWNPNVIAVQEQYALNPTATFRIATEEVKCIHPYCYKRHIHHIMSTDFLVTSIQADGTLVKHAYSYKPKFDKNKPSRTKEKLDIEAVYWDEQKIPYTVLTDEKLSKNWIYTLGYCQLHYDPSLETDVLAGFAEQILIQHQYRPRTPLRNLISRTANLINQSQHVAEKLFKNSVLHGLVPLDPDHRVRLNEALILEAGR